MKQLTRRSLLKAAAGGAAGAAALSLPFIAKADPVWGDVPPSVTTPSPNFGLLHIHCLGGFAPFESFYYRNLVNRRTRGFDSEVSGMVWNAGCGSTPSGLELSPSVFGTDSMGKSIYLGPFAKPLWLRNDIYEHMRVIVQAHNLIPHEAAIPFQLTGRRLGNPGQCSLGAAIAHRYLALDADAGLPPRDVPYAYGLIDGSSSTLLDVTTSMMGSLGMHPGSARPLVLKIGSGLNTLISQLGRSNMSAAKDALLDHYRSQYRDWLRHSGTVTRSNAFRDYDTTLSTLLNAGPLSTFLTSIPTTIASEAECARETAGAFPNQPNSTQTALQAAAFLLTRPPSTRARYVCVIDRGLDQRGVGLGYDVHNVNSAQDTGTNLWNLFSNLAEIINDPLSPPDPNKLNLSETLILITTDFGRTPFKSLGDAVNLTSKGRDHWPQAFVNVMIGGPITSRGVAGSINDALDTGAVADVAYSATDVHAAALVAAGINPFEAENFAIGQLTGTLQAIDHTATMTNLESNLLGL